MENPQAPQEFYDPADIEKNKVFAALAYLGILFFLPLVICPESRFGKFHANQGLLLFLFSAGGSLVLNFIPLLHYILVPLYSLLMFVLFVLGLVNALTGKAKELPVIGSLRIIQ